MSQNLPNKWVIFIIFVILILVLVVVFFNKKQDLNYKIKMNNLIESNKHTQFQVDSSYSIILKNNLEKIELNNKIDSLNQRAISLHESVNDLKNQLKYIKGTYKDLSSDSIFSIAKSRYEKNNPSISTIK